MSGSTTINYMPISWFNTPIPTKVSVLVIATPLRLVSVSSQLVAILDKVPKSFEDKHTVIRPWRSLRVKFYADDRFGIMLNTFYGLVIGIVKPRSKICFL